MSLTLTDSRARQIEDGEIFFASYFSTYPTGGSPSYHRITTGASLAHMVMSIETLTQAKVSLREEVTPPGFTGLLQGISNLNLDSSNTTSVELRADSNLGVVDPAAFEQELPPGKTPAVSPFNENSGVILKANTTYVVYFSNEGPRDSLFSFNWFFREL